jgi:hypothetical protein
MATTSEQTRYTEPTIDPDEAIRLAQRKQLPSHTEPRGPGISELAGNYAKLGGQALQLGRILALSTFHRARNGAMRGYRGAGCQKREHPVRALAIIAGTAFVAGAASRIWRSRTI